MSLERIARAVRHRWDRLPQQGVKRGLPPAIFGYRWLETEPVPAYQKRTGVGAYETIHAPSVAYNPLPQNLRSRDQLPDDAGWWLYSFWDVPERESGETFLATVPDCRIIPCIDEKREFWVTLLNRDQRILEMREMAFRPWHIPVLRKRPAVRLKRATWLLERVYHNYSHWLTAHLPKFLLLKSRGQLNDILLPGRLPAALADSLRLYGIDPDEFATFDPTSPVEVEELTVLGTDRFRPELLRQARDACPITAPGEPRRKVFISRSRAQRRRLLNEDEIWPVLEKAGFERVWMEELTFEQQVRLMRETAVLFAPHGAGLTNMIFCRPGTHVVEIADLGFPNPNFYALAAAMELPYWVLAGEAVGEMHPLEKDLRIDRRVVEEILPELLSSRPLSA